MVSKIKKFFKKFTVRRTTVLLAAFCVMAFFLIRHVFDLQIIQGENYATDFALQTTKTRTVKSTRGKIYDRNKKVLASSILSYSVTLEDNGSYNTTREKNLILNGISYKVLQILKENGDTISRSNFHVVLDENNQFVYDLEEGVNLDRFRADIFGFAMIDELKEKEPEKARASAEEMIGYLSGMQRFSVVTEGKDAYTPEELAKNGLPVKLQPQEILDICIIRYLLSTNTFMKYMPVTIATNVSQETVASIMENKSELQGIDIVEDSIRSYPEGPYFSSIVGYTGKASAEELKELRKKDPAYPSDAVIGKTGIEQYMELDLQGHDGKETVYVDKMGKVLKIEENTKVAPTAGNDVYLTIDMDWQEAIYKILEQRVAGILIANIEYAKTFDVKHITDRSQIRIPIYDVYYALIKNSVLNINHFAETEASDTEKNIYATFQQKQQEVFDRIRAELVGSDARPYKELDEEMQEYLDYIVKDLLTDTLGILNADAIDRTDETYLAYMKKGSISLREYLTYAASQNWVEISEVAPKGDYLDSTEVYQALADYLVDYLKTNQAFSKLLYRYLLLEDRISGRDLCMALYDQGVLVPKDGDDSYERLASGVTSASDFMISKISTLEITPGQLALAPCSASAVLTDAKTGDVLACVTYPGYDNNRLANNMDTEYYNKLLNDLSQPFYNKATQQRTAPGSTFKLVSAIAGFQESIVDTGTGIDCTGSFDLITPPINCWQKTGHGGLAMESAIEQSCNYYFNMIGFLLGKREDGEFSENLSLQKLQTYASVLGLDKKSGVEITESAPHVTEQYAIPSYMGQGTHLYTTSQLARYSAALASSGTIYKMTLLDKVTDSQNRLLQEYSAEIEDQIDLPQSLWDTVHMGMQRVVATHKQFDRLGMTVAGKTGTAEEAEDKPSHGMFIGYGPYEDPQIALAVRIPYGYSSGNACLAAKDIFSYVFHLQPKEQIITGIASEETSSTSND